jgi:beta-phosphoglucomutase
MMRTKACIFDLDGVIVDTAKYYFLAWTRLAGQLGITFTEKDNERLKGVSRMDSLDIILEIGNVDLPESLKLEYAKVKNDWYVEYISKMTPDEILPGCLDFVRSLRSAGIKTAIGSASKNTPMILERVGIEKYFDAVSDGNVVSKAKPNPEVFLKAAEMLGVPAAECFVFEDAQAGVQAALNAGMLCVGIGSAEILNQAHFVVPGLEKMSIERLEIIENEIGK